jgi:transposase
MIKKCNYVGIDISKLSFDVSLKNENEKYSHYKFNNDLKGFKALLKLIKNSQSICVMEASGPYYLKLATFLNKQNIGVCVINPLVIRRFCQMRMMRAKTDKKDAQMIAEYGITEMPSQWNPEASYVLELKQMQAYVEQLNKNRTGYIRQKEAFSFNSTPCSSVIKGLDKMIKLIEKEIQLIEEKMEVLIKIEHQNLFNQLQSIPGIGRKTALALIVVSGGFTKFENAKQLCSYVGLSPRIFESGTSVKGKSRICKMGMSRIRAMLYVCSWTAKKYNKACIELYNRLVEKGKPKKVALIAVVNKLLKQAFTLATKNEFYLEIN